MAAGNPFATKEESKQIAKDYFRDIQRNVEAINAGEGGKLYDSLAAAQAIDPKPVDGTIFTVSKDDAENAGFHSFQSTEPEGTKFERPFPLDEVYEEAVKPRLLPEGKEYVNFDRPDLTGKIVTVDNDLNIISISGDSKDGIEITTGYDRPDLVYAIIDAAGYIIDSEQRYDVGGVSPSPDPTPDLPVVFDLFQDYDRPDLGFAVVDKDNRLLFDPTDMRTEDVPVSDVPIGFWNPPLMDGFDITSEPVEGNLVLDYSYHISKWDELMIPANSHLPNYITKEQIGLSSVGDIPIYRYNFTPPNPKHKIMLISGSHSHEKKYIHILYKFFEYLMNHWWEDELLTWMRWNVDFTILPCRCPYSLSFEGREWGLRITPETEPIPITWTRTGTDVTLTFDLSDFPDNEFLSGENYFSEYADTMEGEGSLGIMNSSDEVALPLDAYKIKTVLAGNSVVVEVPEDAGGTSGTGELQVWTDPNRNWDIKNNTRWHDFTGSDSKVGFHSGVNVGYHDARGTRPYSLRENRVLKPLLDKNDHDFIIDLHGAAADHYLSYRPEVWGNAIYEAIEKMKFFSGQFVATDFEEIKKETYTGARGLPWPSNYHSSFNRGRFHTVEWGGSTRYAEAIDVQNAMRWMIVTVTELAKIKNR